MAKKALKRPELPAGRRLDLFLYLQDQVLRNGDKSVAELARDIGVSHQAIYKALTGPRVPSRAVVQDLAMYLGRPEPLRLVGEVLDLWALAVAEERRVTYVPTGEKLLDDLHSRLWEMRQKSGMSIRDIAKSADIPRSTVYDLFDKSRVPNKDNITAVLDVLGVDEAEKKECLDMVRKLNLLMLAESLIRRSSIE